MTEPITAAPGLPPAAETEFRKGAFLATLAFLWWGFIPFYFKAVIHVDPLEVLAHRVIWSFVFLLAIILYRRRGREFLHAMTDVKTMLTLTASSILIAVNWLTYIYSIQIDQLMDSSLGYYINPLVNVVLGMVILRERLRGWQWVAVSLAAVGVLWMTLTLGRFPWIAMVLAISFGIYGLVRKMATVGPLMGLTIETLILTPISIIYVAWLWQSDSSSFLAGSTYNNVMLLAAGIVTALPLLWYTAGARILNYSTIGILQYLAPTIQFLIAVLAFGEAFTSSHAIAFPLIWAGLALYTFDILRNHRQKRPK